MICTVSNALLIAITTQHMQQCDGSEFICAYVCARVRDWVHVPEKQVQRDYYLGQVKKLKEKVMESYSNTDAVLELMPERMQSVLDDLNDDIVKLKIELVTIQDDWNSRYKLFICIVFVTYHIICTLLILKALKYIKQIPTISYPL